jgi:hypothetical protein
MNHFENLNIYKNVTDNSDSLITFFCYNQKVSILLKLLEEQLSSAKKINNPIKKNKICNGFYFLIKKLEEDLSEDLIISSVFLINEKVFELKLSEENIKTAIEYKFPQCFLRTDNYFWTDYIFDLFCNFTFIYILRLNNNSLTISKINKNKEKDIKKIKISKEDDVIEEFDKIRKENNYKDFIILNGNSQLLQKINSSSNNNTNNINNLKNIIIKKENYNREELFEIYENEKMKINHSLLQKRLDDLQNEKTNIDLYIFGKLKFEIKDAIEYYLIKELYIEEKKLEKLRTFINDSFFNFNIITIRKLESGDIADRFINDYNGIMGIKYF